MARPAHPEVSLVERVQRQFARALRRKTPRERYEQAIDSSTITPEQRRKALENAAAGPNVEAALDEADRAYEHWVKGSKSVELHGRPFTPRSPRR